MTGPVKGIKIIDLTTVVLGPFATQILGDLGAEIIKIESPEGDSCRYLGEGYSPGLSGTAMTLLRNKRSVVLDLKQQPARDALMRLAVGADVFIHNMRPPTAAKLGLNYEKLVDVKPDIIYCAARGFGNQGVYADRPAYDDMIQGASGLSDLIGQYSGTPGFVPSTICDKVTGITAVYAILAALFHRERSGEGQAIDVPMLETMTAFNLAEHFVDAVFDPPKTDPGYQRLLTANRRPHKARDGYICILPYSDRNWRDFFQMSGREEMLTDDRFSNLVSRTKHIEALYGIVAEAALEKSCSEWQILCDRHAIPCQTVTALKDLMDDPHLKSAGFFKAAQHPSEGAYHQTGIPVEFSKTPGDIRRHAPILAQHTAEVLTDAGFSQSEIDGLVRSGAAVVPTDPKNSV